MVDFVGLFICWLMVVLLVVMIMIHCNINSVGYCGVSFTFVVMI